MTANTRASTRKRMVRNAYTPKLKLIIVVLWSAVYGRLPLWPGAGQTVQYRTGRRRALSLSPSPRAKINADTRPKEIGMSRSPAELVTQFCALWSDPDAAKIVEH